MSANEEEDAHGDSSSAAPFGRSGERRVEATIPLIAERLHVGKREIVRGVVHVRKEIDTRTESVEAEGFEEEIVVERRPLNVLVDAAPAVREEDGVTVVPVLREEIVLQKRLRLVEEVCIRRVRHKTRIREDVVLREEQVRTERTHRPGGALATQSHSEGRMMDRTIAGMFDSRSAADEVRQALVYKGISNDRIEMHDEQSTRGDAATDLDEDRHESGIVRFFRRMFGLEEDGDESRYYAEGIRRGHVVLTVRVADDDELQAAEEIMQRGGAVDIDERAEQWRQSGWTAGEGMQAGDVTTSGTTAGATGTTTGMGTTGDDRYGAVGGMGARAGDAAIAGAGNIAASPGSTATAGGETQRIPVVQEDIQVGKRIVRRGVLRVYSHVTETPVEKSVTLTEERADVQRRAADRPATAEDLAAMREGAIDIEEKAEVPVVQKEARVVGEVDVGKTATQRTEQVRDTVRRSDVTVERADEESAPVASSGQRDKFSEDMSRGERSGTTRDRDSGTDKPR